MYEKEVLPSDQAVQPLPEASEIPDEEVVVSPDQGTDAVVPVGDPPDAGDVVGVSGGDAAAPSAGHWIYIPDTDVSASDLEPVSSGDASVSAGDSGGSRSSGSAFYYTEYVESADYSGQLEDIADKLDYCGVLLSLIAGLLLFYWCHSRVRNAVRSFTGRNAIDE